MNLRDDLKAYLDGELPPERMAEMREAIDRDPALAQEAEGLRRISQTLQAAAAQPASMGLEATLRALEKAERRERKPWWPWLVPIAGMGAFLVFAVIPTVRQAEMAGSSDAAVAFHKDAESPATMSAPVMERGIEGDATTDGASAAKSARGYSSAEPMTDLRARSTAHDSAKRAQGTRAEERFAKGTVPSPSKNVPRPKNASASSSLQNARPGNLKGESLPSSSDFRATRNILVEPEENKDAKAKESTTLAVGVAQAKVPIETIVVEVESLEEANDAARALMAKMGVEETPAVTRSKEERDSVGILFDAVSNRNQIPTERRVVLEVNEDELAETKKRVTETVKESQVRREGQQNRTRGGANAPGGPGGGFAAGGFSGASTSQSQQAETSQGGRQQGPPDPLQRSGQQSPTAQGNIQGFQGRTASPKANVSPTPEGKKTQGDLQKSKQNAPKPRKRIEVVFRIKPKPAGKLEE